LLAARASAERTARALKHKKSLGGAVSRSELEGAEADAGVAAATRRAAEAVLSALRVGLDLPSPVDGRFPLRAPIRGSILDCVVSIGRVVDADEDLCHIADLHQQQVGAHAFKGDAVRLLDGSHADVTLSALPGTTFASATSRVRGEVNVNSRTVSVRLDLAPNPRLRPGMPAHAAVDDAATEAANEPPRGCSLGSATPRVLWCALSAVRRRPPRNPLLIT